MDDPRAEKAKAQRAIRILYLCVALGVALPAILLRRLPLSLMNRTLLPIRLLFLVVCAATGYLLCFTVTEWDGLRGRAAFIGLSVGGLVVLTDVLLKGFSLRGLSAITFGLGVGTLIAYWIGNSPLFRWADPEAMFLSQIVLYLVSTYLCTVVALRGKDEFNLVIPYVRFVPKEVEAALLIVDSSALIDGRIARLAEQGFLNAALVIPRFVLNEVQSIADSSDAWRQVRGRRGLDTLAALRRVPGLEIRIIESEVAHRKDTDAKLVFLAESMKARIVTLDVNLAKLAEFHGIKWLNLQALVRALRSDLTVGESIEVELVKPGKEEGQAVGFLDDGNMVVVENGRPLLGKQVSAEVTRILPSAGGKMVFARLTENRGV